MKVLISSLRWLFQLNGFRGAMSILIATATRKLLRRPVTEAYCNYRDSFFDGHFGVETANVVEAEDLDIPPAMRKESQEYRPTSAVTCAVTVDRLPIDPSEYHFVDIGCGKGRVVLIASQMPFASVTGIELSPSLCQRARQNLAAQSGGRRCSGPVEIVEGDATQGPWPPGPLVVYLFNPFSDDLVRRLETSLAKSLSETPRACWIVYANAVCRAVFDETKHWRAIEQNNDWWAVYRWIETH